VNFWTSRTFEVSAIMLGATGGAAGWILGARQNLAAAGRDADAAIVFWCTAGVFLTGGVLWLLWVAGRRLSLLVVMDVLLGASLVFGVLALWIMHARGVLALALDPSGKYPEWLAWAAPVLVLAFLAGTWYPPIRRWFQRTKLERNGAGEPQSPR
jgi:hypothetical protein